jgi:hypothetical protein
MPRHPSLPTRYVPTACLPRRLQVGEGSASLFGFAPSTLLGRNIADCVELLRPARTVAEPASTEGQRWPVRQATMAAFTQRVLGQLAGASVSAPDTSWRVGLTLPLEAGALDHLGPMKAAVLAKKTSAAIMEVELLVPPEDGDEEALLQQELGLGPEDGPVGTSNEQEFRTLMRLASRSMRRRPNGDGPGLPKPPSERVRRSSVLLLQTAAAAAAAAAMTTEEVTAEIGTRGDADSRVPSYQRGGSGRGKSGPVAEGLEDGDDGGIFDSTVLQLQTALGDQAAEGTRASYGPEVSAGDAALPPIA